ncbi:MAG: gliding motility protein GldC [Flavobacteriaceae bacterium]|nr:gliding motility protein GldC [Flavobacteriaceae bacterium]
MSIHHTSTITLKIGLDENRVPEELTWSAEDGGVNNESAKALLLSVWDHNQKEALKIDLWTKDMPVDEMKIFFHQTLVALSRTYEKATQDAKLSAALKEFCDFFEKNLEIP